MTFNLVNEPWIPVASDHEPPRELSLSALFREAEQLRGLAIAFPPERVAVSRLLVAILQSANAGPRNAKARGAWLADPAEARDATLAYLDAWQHRFGLFDPERPFMQAPVQPGTGPATIANLRLDWASGNNVTLFDHSVDGRPPALTPAEAARAMLTTLLYQPGGGVSKPFNRTDSPGTKGLMVLAQGETLWETIALNTPRRTPSDEESEARPAWELDDAQTLKADPRGSTPRGWLELATWQSRAIRLERDADGMVRTCRINQHLKLADGEVIRDPFIPLRRDKDGEIKIHRLAAGRRLWRSADTVLLGLTDEVRGVVAQRVAADAVATYALIDENRRPHLVIVGLQIDQAKIGDGQLASLPVSEALLGERERIESVRHALKICDQGARALGLGIGAYQAALGRERDNATHDHWRQPFWGRVGGSFAKFVDDAGRSPEPLLVDEGRFSVWKEEVVEAATDVMRTFVFGGVDVRRQAQAFAKAEDRFARALRELDLVPTSLGTSQTPSTTREVV